MEFIRFFEKLLPTFGKGISEGFPAIDTESLFKTI
jgi:hypothetical protein